MKIAILGAGVIGVTTAHYLARQGHEVTVIDRQTGPALETSFANAGEISPGYSSPWAAPGIPAKAVKWLFMRHAPLILHPQINALAAGPAAQLHLQPLCPEQGAHGAPGRLQPDGADRAERRAGP